MKVEIFKKISVGGLSSEALIQSLRSSGIRFNQYAETLFEHRDFLPMTTSKKTTLVKVKLSDLSLKNLCSLQEIIDQASALGLRPCPLYLGAFLRLEYTDQPEGPHLTIISAQPETDENYPTGFYIRNFDGALWLRGYRAIGVCEWPPDGEFLFQIKES